ncbi:MAG TPA: phosphotransferase [Dehalococcoidia bacterium]
MKGAIVPAAEQNASFDLTPASLTLALRANATIQHARVSGVQVMPLGEDQGTTARLYRVAVTYDLEEPGAPASLIAKLSRNLGPLAIAEQFRLYEREARFYTTIAPVPNLRTPRVYYSADHGNGEHTLILEDMAPAREGDVVAGCSVETIARAVDAVASMHAQYWDSVTLGEQAWLPRPNADTTVGFALEHYPRSWRIFERQTRSPGPEVVAAGYGLCGDRSVLDRLSSGPCTLTHGDLRLNNLLFDAGGGLAAVIDWQTVTFARGPMDLASLLVSNLDPADCARAEADLIPRYVAKLREYGVDGYSLDECWMDYRLSVLSQFAGVVMLSAILGIGGNHEETIAAVVGRPLKAVARLRLHELLPTRRARPTQLLSRLRSRLLVAPTRGAK